MTSLTYKEKRLLWSSAKKRNGIRRIKDKDGKYFLFRKMFEIKTFEDIWIVFFFKKFEIKIYESFSIL
jgi:hypothetical protein